MSAISPDIDIYIRDILELPNQVLQARLIAAERAISIEEARNLLEKVTSATPHDTTTSKNKISPGSPQLITKKQKVQSSDVTSTVSVTSGTACAEPQGTAAAPDSQSSDHTTQPPKAQKEVPKPDQKKEKTRKDKAHKGKTMDWSKVHRRRIALQFCYLGEKYAGLAIQDGYETVESQLFHALTKTCLIPDLTQCNYTRCGRTDKGVNARMQVIALDVRSNYPFTKAAKERAAAAEAAAATGPDSTSVPASGSDSASAPASGSDSASAPPTVRMRGYVPPYTTTEEYVRAMAAMRGVTVPATPLTQQDITQFYVDQFQPLRRHVGRKTDVEGPTGADAAESEAQMGDGSLPSVSSTASLSAESLRSAPLPSALTGPREAVAWSSTYDTAAARQEKEWDEWADEHELDYVTLLNNVLPDDIRVTAWAPVDFDFSARFSCDVRVYKYLFYADNMDLERMDRAAKLLKGTHDFRNLCKMDVVHLTHFVRRVCDACVQVCPNTDYTDFHAGASGAVSGDGSHMTDASGDQAEAGQHVNALRHGYQRPPVTGAVFPASVTNLTTTMDDKTVIEASVNNNVFADGSVVTTTLTNRSEAHGPILLPTPSHTVTAQPVHRDMALSNASSTAGSSGAIQAVSVAAPSSKALRQLPPDTLCEFVVVGEAFLYHQVRCMMAVLFLVGQGLEQPEIITELLDISKHPAKPTYEMAADQPLILWDGIFADVKWRVSTVGLQKAFGPLYRQWREWRMKASVMETFWRTLLPTAVQCALDVEDEWKNDARKSVGAAEGKERAVEASGAGTEATAGHQAASSLPEWHRSHPVTASVSAAHRPDLRAMVPVHAAFGTTVARTVPFLQLAPAITSKNLPSTHPQPLSLVASTFPPLLGNHMHNILRARGFMGFQTKIGKLAKVTPISTEEEMWGRIDDGTSSTSLFPFAECYGHIPLHQRPRENTLEEKVGSLTGKKRDLKERSTEFMEWLKERVNKEEA